MRRQADQSDADRPAMRTLWWPVLLLAATIVSASAAVNASWRYDDEAFLQKRAAGVKRHRTKTIYRGKKAKVKDLPFQVYVRVFLTSDEKEFCGGSIIGTRHILTAAHCVKMPNIEKVCIYVGRENRFDSNMHKYTVVRRHIYPKEPHERITGDIAVFMVDRSMSLGKMNVNQIKLVGPDPIKPNTTCSVSGWGSTEYEDNEKEPNVLRSAKVPLVPAHLCRKAYADSPPDDLLCAGFYDTGGADSCKGDSGGPLVCNGVLTGLVKSGKGCGLPKYPGSYTDVRYYRKWIKSVVAKDMISLFKSKGKTKFQNICMPYE